MSGIKKFSELSKEELISRMSRVCCYKCEYIEDLDSGTYWSCSGCECVCCDYCVEKGDIDNEKIGEDCGFYCEECREKFLKEKEEEKQKKKVEEKESDEEENQNDQTCEECGEHNTDNNNIWQCFTLSNGNDVVYCDECVDDGHWECCHECNVLMGDKIFDDRDEFEEHPDRPGGYDDENGWFCNNHRQEEESGGE